MAMVAGCGSTGASGTFTPVLSTSTPATTQRDAADRVVISNRAFVLLA